MQSLASFPSPLPGTMLHSRGVKGRVQAGSAIPLITSLALSFLICRMEVIKPQPICFAGLLGSHILKCDGVILGMPCSLLADRRDAESSGWQTSLPALPLGHTSVLTCHLAGTWEETSHPR